MERRKRILDHYDDGSREVWHDLGENKFAITHEWDTEMLDALKLRCKIIADQADAKADGMRQERQIPTFVMQRAMNQGWFNDPAKWREWANSEEGRAFGIPYNGKVNKL